MYWRKERDSEIDSLKIVIEDVLSKHNFCQDDKGKALQDDLSYQISVKVWEHQQHTKESEKKSFIEDVHPKIEEILRRTADRIQDIQRDAKGEIQSSNRQYGEAAVRKAMKILRADLEKQFDPANYSKDVKGFLQFNPLSHAWIAKENELIVKIQDLLDKHNQNLNPNWKTEVIASIFTECNIWTNQDQSYGKMRKRLPSVELKRKDLAYLADLKKVASNNPLCEICGALKSDCQCDLFQAGIAVVIDS